jgi:hypothetical protein
VIETSPSPYTRVRAIRTNNPARVNHAITEKNSVWSDAGNCRSPQQAGAELRRSFRHEAMQSGSADREAATVRWKSSIR